MKLKLLGVFLVILTLLFCRSALLNRNRKLTFSYEVRMSSWNNCWVTLRQNNNDALKKRKNKPPEKCYYPPSLPPSRHLWHFPLMGKITFIFTSGSISFHPHLQIKPTFSFFLAAAESFFVCWLFFQTKEFIFNKGRRKWRLVVTYLQDYSRVGVQICQTPCLS